MMENLKEESILEPEATAKCNLLQRETSLNDELCNQEMDTQVEEQQPTKHFLKQAGAGETSLHEELLNQEMDTQGEKQKPSKHLLEQEGTGETSLHEKLCNQEMDTQDEDQKPTKRKLEQAGAGKHKSIQKKLSHLEDLANQADGLKKPCPLCPEDLFKSCPITKLLRHLQNFHWKVSVEFEEYRMCICYLPCLQNTAQNENELPNKTSAHYHCIICSATVARRRTEMLRHIKCHVEKGETQVMPSVFSRPQKILHESNTEVQVLPNCNTPQQSGTFFNPIMKTNRQLIFCALAVLTEERQPLECLDAFSATGIMGLQWAKHLGNSVKVTLNDISDSSTAIIRENCQLNKMKVLMKSEEKSEVVVIEEKFVNTVEVTQMDANVLMHTRSFDFIHLDPFGTSVNYLDAAFRNIRNQGIVSVTSTDTGSLYAKTVHVTKRYYGCNIIRTEYFKELAVRIVLAAIARAAARCNKGIDVLLSVALEHFVLVIVRVLRGPSLADESLKMISNLIHCHWCEERIFQKEGTMLEENPYKQLPCDCHESMPGRSAALLGPMWSGSLFNTSFLRRMLYKATSQDIVEIHTLLKTLICESECITVKQFSVHPIQYSQGKRKRQHMNMVPKRLKNDTRAEHPPFYYSIHRHAIGGLNLPKLNKILQYLSEAGFLVSRTHFDPTGIRTNAPLATIKAILEKNSSLSHTSQSSSCKDTPEAITEESLTEEMASVSDVK
ncbi:TRMT1-like protein isoform X2 [Rana temporaria]|uniref:TRMT1-like protein isoform X2 n=1 Tax=Rana temporaria TaxID=8407 RepID=UPI001AACA471|nr:TRMT1-like protein isoform X2 [Rana temporaria]